MVNVAAEMHALETQLCAHQIMTKMLPKLPPREVRVVNLRFGLDGGGPHTLREIAEDLGRSVERIRQIEHRALERLRKMSCGVPAQWKPAKVKPAPAKVKSTRLIRLIKKNDWCPPPPIEGSDYWRRDALMNRLGYLG